MSLCFPEKDLSWKKNILKSVYVNLGINLFEFFYLPELDQKKINGLVDFENHNIVESSAGKKRGTFFLSAHYSNWELTAFAFSIKYGSSLKIIAKAQSSKKLNARINEYRTSGGNEILQIGYSLRSIFEMLDRNEITCFLIDQSANPDYSVYVNFFGQNTATFSGPAKIALKKRPGLILAYGTMKKDFSYVINFENIEYEDLQEYTDDNVVKLTQRIQSKLEEVIRKDPGQWLWLHRRFKHIK